MKGAWQNITCIMYKLGSYTIQGGYKVCVQLETLITLNVHVVAAHCIWYIKGEFLMF